jgi:hypothetical protein
MRRVLRDLTTFALTAALLLCASPVFAALSANNVIEIRQAGNSANAGFFNPTNANMATDLAATSANTVSPIVTSASYTFVAGDVGAYVFIKSGTNWTPGWYRIASVAGGAATLTAGVGTSVLWQNATSVLNTVAGVATVASPTAGTWTVDYSQQNAAAVAFTDLVIDAVTNTKFTSAAHPIGKNMVGNGINVTGGTGFTVQRVEVVSVTGTTGTADKSLGTLGSTGGTGNLGGACSLLTDVTGFYLASNKIFVKADGTYLQTATAAFATGATPTGSVPMTWIQGYSATRGDKIRPTIQLSTNSGLTAVSVTGAGILVDSLIINCNSLTTSTGILLNGNPADAAINCKVMNFTTAGINISTSGVGYAVQMCEVTGGVAGATAGIIVSHQASVTFCDIHDNACPGISANDNLAAGFNLITNNSGASSDGIISAFAYSTIVQNTIYGNGSDGIHLASANLGPGMIVRGNILAKNGGWGMNIATASFAARLQWDGNAYWSNTSGTQINGNAVTVGNTGVAPYVDSLDVVISGSDPTNDPFVSKGTGDFRLNNTAGAGKLLRGKAFPGLLPGNASRGYLDFGCFQHVDVRRPEVRTGDLSPSSHLRTRISAVRTRSSPFILLTP